MSIHILIGTSKGAFVLSGEPDRKNWHLTGPHCDLWPINHVIGDPDTGMLWAGGGSDWHGAGIWRSADTGLTWTLAKLAGGQIDEWAKSEPDHAAILTSLPEDAPFTGDISAIWSLSVVGARVFAGAKPASLYASDDAGKTWSKLHGLTDHSSRDSWSPGGAGLILHTIVPDPFRAGHMSVAISAAGVFSTEDGGVTWERANRLDNAEGQDNHADGAPNEIGHCVHNMVRTPSNGDLLYQQNHQGVFRSSDGGRIWHDITAGLPSRFGFPIAAHPRDAGTVWTIPLNGDIGGRFPPGAAAAVWKSTDGGETWSAKRAGLPQANCFFTVLRQAMATDRERRTGLYFGTNTGSLFGSFDEGESWSEIARHLPTIFSVEVLTLA